MVTVRIIWPIAEEYNGFESASTTKKTRWACDAWTYCNMRSVQASAWETNLGGKGLTDDHVLVFMTTQAVMQYLNRE